MSTQQGHCLCGAVQFSVNQLGTCVHACHCRMCRRWGGGPFMCVEATDVSFSGEASVRVYDSSEWAERGFCTQCGTHLYYRLKSGKDYQVPVGLFDQQETFHFDLQVFIDHKPDWYCFAGDTSTMTEAQVIEHYASE